MIHHERDVREEQQHIYVVRTSNNRVIAACDLLLLTATVRSFACLLLGLSDRNSMMNLVEWEFLLWQWWSVRLSSLLFWLSANRNDSFYGSTFC